IGLRSGVSESPTCSRRCRKCARRSSRTSVHWTSTPPSAKDSRRGASSAGGSAPPRLGRAKLALTLARYLLLPFAFAYDATALERAQPGLQHMSMSGGGVCRFQLYAHLPCAATIAHLAPGEGLCAQRIIVLDSKLREPRALHFNSDTFDARHARFANTSVPGIALAEALTRFPTATSAINPRPDVERVWVRWRKRSQLCVLGTGAAHRQRN